MKYIKREDYEEFLLNYRERHILRLACCDCGLVHSYAFHKYKDGHLGIAARREPRATAQLRRHRFGSLQNRDGRYRLVDTNDN